MISPRKSRIKIVSDCLRSGEPAVRGVKLEDQWYLIEIHGIMPNFCANEDLKFHHPSKILRQGMNGSLLYCAMTAMKTIWAQRYRSPNSRPGDGIQDS